MGLGGTSSEYDDLDKYPTLPLEQVGDISPAIGADDRGLTQNVAPKQKTLEARIESDSPKPTGLGGSLPKPVAPAPRPMTPAEMMLAADNMQKAMQAQHDYRMAQGPAVRRLADGTPENGFNTELTQGAEKAYQGQFGNNSDQDYDLRGAFAAHETDNQPVKFNEDGVAYFPNHLRDTYKKPSHETFSDESQYADQGWPGSWSDGDKFNLSAAQRPPPAWLTNFMQQQAMTPPPVDTSKLSGYLDERDRLKAIKALQR